MTNRAGIVCVSVCSGALALLAGMNMPVKAAGATLAQTAELADTALATLHNSLYRSGNDQIFEDRGVRFGSIGSDIFHDPDESANEFWMLSDRGPNGNPGKRTFVVPQFNPVIVHVRVKDNAITIIGALPIVDSAGRPVTGMPNVDVFDEVPWSFDGSTILPLNANGLDTEAIVRTRNGSFWVVDEYSPSLLHISSTGRILDRFVPEDSQLATTVATTPNYRVRKYLPKILNFRRQNRGFEGLAISPDEKTLYLAVQSPLEYPTRALGRASRNIRILRFDIGSEQVTGEFAYQYDEVCSFSGQPAGCTISPDEMKISSMSAISATSLLIDERTDPIAKVYRVDLSNATNILGTQWDTVAAAPMATTTALETTTAAASGITFLPKTLVLDLTPFNLPTKIEGITLVSPTVLAVSNDNDFGLTDTATFTSNGKLNSDTLVKSKIWFFNLADAVR